MKSILAGVSALSLAAAVMPAVATATPVPATGNAAQGLADLRQLNLIVTGNLTGGGQDVEGKAFIGGNLSNGTFNNANSHGYAEASSSFADLTVGGNETGNININHANGPNGGFHGANIGGNAGTVSINGTPSALYVGGTVQNYNANGQTYQTNVAGLKASIASQTTTFVSDLKALSSALAALAPTAGSSYFNPDQNTNTFIAKDSGKGYAVIDITAAQIQAANNFTYNIPTLSGGGYLPTIINVSGATSYNIKANSNNSAYDPYVLFNYVDATSINFGNQVSGSVLAPLASISNSSPLEGSIAVANFAQSGEVHVGNFLGAGVTNGGKTDPAFGLDRALGVGGAVGGVPEPATWAMMLVGFGIAGAALRRRGIAVAA